MEAYLNSNFYGNQSYGVKAAALGYFGKELDQLSPGPVRRPRRHPAVADQVRPDAQRRPRVRASWSRRATSCPASEVTLVVPDTDDPNDIVSRRNYVLEQMKLHSVLSAGKYTADRVRGGQGASHSS